MPPATSRRTSTGRRRSRMTPPPQGHGSSCCPSTSSTAATTPASARPPARSPGHTPTRSPSRPRRDVWILAGSLAESGADPDRPYNTSVLFAPDGAIAATYRKIHLFDVAVDDGPVDRESARVTRRRRAVVVDVDGVRVGLSHLLRPALSRAVPVARAGRRGGPDGARRTSPNGPAATIGRSCCGLGRSRTARTSWPRRRLGGPPGQPAFGRSMVIDPWGTVVAQAPDGVRDRPSGGRHRPRRLGPTPDPVPRQPPAGHIPPDLGVSGPAAVHGPENGKAASPDTALHMSPPPYGGSLLPIVMDQPCSHHCRTTPAGGDFGRR